MELFKEPLAQLKTCLDEADSKNILRRFHCDHFSAWPEESSLVLQEDTALELGGGSGSLFMILWTTRVDLVSPGRISLVGPDPIETGARRMPLTQIILVRGAYDDEYETFQVLQDAVFDTRLKGISTRIWPDRQKIWCRVSREAIEQGFDLMRYGCTLLKNLNKLPAVKASEIFFCTQAVIEKTMLTAVAEKVQDILEALLKMYEELNFDCENCPYNEVCAEVTGLKEIHQRLHEEREYR